jgi:hypothetical protein
MTFDCEGCDRKGLHCAAGRYEGRPVQSWGRRMICNVCREWGIVPGSAPALEAWLKGAGIPLDFNQDGSIRVPE